MLTIARKAAESKRNEDRERERAEEKEISAKLLEDQIASFRTMLEVSNDHLRHSCLT